ncbi:MAG: DASS family sodium-coupled anion symporter [candidate division KSB1 bacterium]|nr:DASS family sodium-coupled anion symporter [candidate division KSB1 bacterium]MDZ7335299.1 DASS family sodium-coupled anion symporter [candidate division KSB1 bacterium]MDZ7357223.1 DASS family sodium-coupled anion symporter [candidate division KSB1 bacterium]MDZ7376962.1 DASS family sodium-coupled anion symporter [candidate division KSB1 bacterium]MDZ7399088.1 DASS family sodium-coupled anion symporter [candidate division KSB1 bacterium]
MTQGPPYEETSAVITEAISETEQRFDRWRRTISLFLGPAVFILFLIIPMPALTVQAHRLAAIIALVLIYWVGEALPIPITALLGPVLCIILGIASPTTVFAPFSSPIIFLFLGSFLLARGMIEQQLDQRIALSILSLRWIGNRPYRLVIAIALIPSLISMWISDSATTAMIYPILLGIIGAFGALSQHSGQNLTSERFNTGLLLTIAYGALIGGIGTPIGTPPNLIGIGMLDKILHVRIYFFQWMMLAIPILIVMWLIMVLFMMWRHPPAMKRFPGLEDFLRQQQKQQGPWTRGQRNALIAFLVAVVLWIAPGIIASGWGTDCAAFKFCEQHLPEGIASMAAAILLFILPVNWRERRFTLTWSQAVKIDWGTILLFGGGLSLGGLMFTTNLADVLGKQLIAFGGATSLWSITLIAIILAHIITEMTSNTATANMLVPIMIAVAQSAGVSAIPPTLGVCLGASMAFMLPVSTPSNAIVYGSGKVPITAMLTAGVILDILSTLVIFLGLRILCPLLDLI